LGRIEAKRDAREGWIARLERERPGGGLGGGTWGDLIRRATTGGGALPELPLELRALPQALQDEVLYRVSYAGYLSREERQIAKLSRVEKIRLPAALDYGAVRGLRRESALKLNQIRPYTLGQASRISGVNPADISILMIYVESRTTSPD
jgi:tRNA uridine 5-carboxymethylaminomethyl modification enzyme